MALYSIINFFDQKISRIHNSLVKERNALSTFLFHGLFNNAGEIELKHGMPQQSITTSNFREFIEYYLKKNYEFISPEDISKGLDPNKKFALITFDDGYFNNQLAVPILNEYKVPAIFFISSAHILQNKSFWWDIIYRERIKRQSSLQLIDNEVIYLKSFKNREIEQYILKEFGKNAFIPISDIDRPFTPAELKTFAGENFVHIGNHTTNHAILTNYSDVEIKMEITNAQEDLVKLTGKKPIMIAYPNGRIPLNIIPILKECNIKLGVSTKDGKNYFPLNIGNNEQYLLKRFTLWGNKDITLQCELFRSDLHLKNRITHMIKNR